MEQRAVVAALLVVAVHSTTGMALEKGSLDSAQLRVPVVFERNQGQMAGSAEYFSRAGGYTLLLDSGGASLRPASRRAGPGRELRIEFVGSNPETRIVGLEPTGGVTNYFLGDDPARWRRDIPHYATVRYEDLYAGIDLVFHGSARGEIEFDLIVAPGVDPERIRMAYDGADDLTIGADGDLLLRMGDGTIRQAKPTVYQQIEGEPVQIDGSYLLTESGLVGFSLGAYDRTLPLVIDPIVRYASFLGGNFFDHTYDVAVSDQGLVYLLSDTNSTNFPTMNAVQEEYDDEIPRADLRDTAITVLDPTDNTLIYSTYLGGRYFERSVDIAVDSNGAAYATGWTWRACAIGVPCPLDLDFPVTPGAFLTDIGDISSWVVKLSPTGSLLYGTYLRGAESTLDTINAIDVDSSGRAYVTGLVHSTDFPTTANAFQSTCTSDFGCLFFTVLTADGSDLAYSTILSSSDGRDLAVDASGKAYLTGRAYGSDFPVTAGAFQGPEQRNDERWQCPVQLGCNCSNSDAHVAKIDPNQSGVASLVYATFLGSVEPGFACTHTSEWAFGIDVDTSGNAYVLGIKEPAVSIGDFPLHNALLDVPLGGGNQALFITKLDPTGSALVYSTYAPFTRVLNEMTVPDVRIVDTGVDATGAYYALGDVDGSVLHKVSPAGDAVVYDFVVAPDFNPSTPSFRTSASGMEVTPAGEVYVVGLADNFFVPTPDGFQTDHQSPALSLSDGFLAIVGEPDPPSVADLAVTKDDGDVLARKNQTLTYSIDLNNEGPDAVVGATVMDVLPTALTNATWSCLATAGSSCGASGSGNLNDMADLLPGGSATYTVTGTVSASASPTITNTATVVVPMNVIDPNGANDLSTVVTSVSPCIGMDSAVHNDILQTVQTIESCGTLTLGPNLTLASSARVTVRAEIMVVLEDGFTMEPGAEMSIELDPSLTP